MYTLRLERFNKIAIAFCLTCSLSGCALTGKQTQSPTFSTYPMPSLQSGNTGGDSDDSAMRRKVSRIEKDQEVRYRQQQENFQAAMQGLVGVNGKVSGIEEANVTMRNDVAALKGDLATVKDNQVTARDISGIKGELNNKIDAVQTSVTLAIQTELRAELSAFRSETKNTISQGANSRSTINQLPWHVWVGVVGIVLGAFGLIGYVVTRKELIRIKRVMNPKKSYISIGAIPAEAEIKEKSDEVRQEP